ncbi:hypothetical protein HJD18_15270 [Thermoleophilia bacterium SCSIO 60948]|nr:hypothetical protein HJD18_15270 [Thermoleophilia bacterium SCSIO 60948]
MTGSSAIYGSAPTIGPLELGLAAVGLLVSIAISLAVGVLLMLVGLVLAGWKLLNAPHPPVRQVGLFALLMSFATLVMVVIGASDGARVVVALSFIATFVLGASGGGQQTPPPSRRAPRR